MNKMKFKDKEFNVLKLLGKGKGGYSYLVEDGDHNLFVLKKIHHEPCSYYSFPEDKLSLELNDIPEAERFNALKVLIISL